MKILLILFVLFFSSLVVAEDISDFQIEGMSVGDSALNYYSKEQIKNNTQNWYNNNDFIPVVFQIKSDLYSSVEFNYKRGDVNYIIHSISGINYPENPEECYIKQKLIISELENTLLNTSDIKKVNIETKIHWGDSSGKSTFTRGGFEFISGALIDVECQDFTKESGFTNKMYISMSTKEFMNFLSIAY